MLGAGDRMAGDEMHALRAHAARICATTEPLVEPTSVRMAPGFSAPRDRLGDRAGGADRHGDDDEIGIAHRLGRVDRSSDRRGRALRPAAASPRCGWRWRYGRPAPARRTTRASDEPIRPMPTRAILENSGCGTGLQLSRNSDERRDDAAIGVLGADGHAQRIGKAVAGDAPQDDSRAPTGKRRPPSAVCLPSSGKCTSTKLPTLGVTLQPEPGELGGQPGQPLLVVRDGALDMARGRRSPRRRPRSPRH